MSKLTKERTHWGEYDKGYIIDGKNLFDRINDLYKILNKEKPDICIFSQYSSIYTLVGLFWCLNKKTEYIIGPSEPMNVNKNILRHYFRLMYFGFISKKAKGIAAMGNNAIRMYSKVYSGPIKNIYYIFDYNKLRKFEKNYHSEKLVFLYSGRLSNFRNPLCAIQCFSNILKKNMDQNLELIMSGKGELYNECINLIEKEGIKENVIWMNDFKNWHDIHNIYKDAHILLALQHYSTWGIIIQEAMAANMGVIATRTIESADNLIVDNFNGFLVNLDMDEIEERMQNYIDSRNLLSLHGKRASDTVASYPIGKQIEQWNILIEK